MLDEIVGALERHPGVSDWSVLHHRSRSVQLYLVGREIENQREVAVEGLDVEVFNDHDVPGRGRMRGVSGLKLVPADAGRLQQRLDDAVLMAQLVHNPPYALAGPATYPDVPLADPELSTPQGAAVAAQAFAGHLWDLVAAEPGVRLS